MRVKLRCPNKECQKVLTLEIPKPGVGVRCKSCGTAFRVPKSAGGASKSSSSADEDIEEYDDEPEEVAPRPRRPQSGGSRPAARRQTRPRDDYDEYDDEF